MFWPWGGMAPTEFIEASEEFLGMRRVLRRGRAAAAEAAAGRRRGGGREQDGRRHGWVPAERPRWDLQPEVGGRSRGCTGGILAQVPRS